MPRSQETHRSPARDVMEAHVTVTSAPYTARAGQRLIGVNHPGPATIVLPSAQLRAGRSYTVKDESGAAAANPITVAPEGAATIDGAAQDTIAWDYGGRTYYSDGANWFIAPQQATAGGAGPAAGVSRADREAIEAETDEGTYVSPNRVRHSPGVAKLWLAMHYDSGTPVIDTSYNVDSLTDVGTGVFRVVISNDFSGADYAVVATPSPSGGMARMATTGNAAAGTVDVFVWRGDGRAKLDDGVCVAAFGDQ